MSDSTNAPRPHVFLDELPWDIRPRNTDWRYVRFDLPRLTHFEPELPFVQQRSPAVTLAGNARAIGSALARRARFFITDYPSETCRLSSAELRASGANVVFSHRAFPVNAGDIPVVLQSAILDPVMQRSYGISEVAIRAQYEMKGPLFRRSTAVQVSTEIEAQRHRDVFPDIADRFFSVPMFAPHISTCSEGELEKHRSPDEVRILFVGNNALRKGLDLLLEASLALPQSLRARARLTVISSFDRSAMKLPSNERITLLGSVGRDRVIEEMRRAHIFVNVARFESYGLVFHEAMSQGLACLAPQWEVQREMFDDGRAGINLPCDSVAIRQALERLIMDEGLRASLARAAWLRFQERYAPQVVAKKYLELFRYALAHSAGKRGV